MLHSNALRGIAGDYVRLIEPTSEADPAAVLIQFLAAFGSALGRGPHYVADGSAHRANLFVLLVGQSSRGRKGTAWRLAKQALEEADAGWAKERVVSGLSSGEGLVHAVRDPKVELVPVKRDGQTEYEEQTTDRGVSDKRLLSVEEEFGAILRQIKRESNILSAVLRQAWDGVSLRVLTKNSAACSTEPHISLIGHITQDELKTQLDKTEASNGFLNRFLVACVRRSKELPDGGNFDGPTFRKIAGELGGLLPSIRGLGRLYRDAKAQAWWRDHYSLLTTERGGAYGAITARGEAHVTRLGCVYALLDGAAEIGVEHMESALALWSYCDDSVRYLFGDSTGNKLADDIVTALRGRNGEMTRTQIRDHFDRNRSKQDLDRALALLERLRILTLSVRPKSIGRPETVAVLASLSYKSLTHTNGNGHGNGVL